MQTADFSSPFYPYEKVQTGYNTMRGSELIPYKILMYLLDLPDANGYTPADDNERPRVRLAKYLWYDGPNPLANALPTPAEKLSMVYNGDEPNLNTREQSEATHPKGYRVYPQVFWGESERDAQTTLKCYIGRIYSTTPFVTNISLEFDILVSTKQENTTRTDAYSRAYNIEQCIVEALHGVNITGIGVIHNDRMSHGDNSSRPTWDEGTHIGRKLIMSLQWADSSRGSAINDY